MRHIAPSLGLLLLFIVTMSEAQGKPSQVCSLLIASDLSSVGATGQGSESTEPFFNDATSKMDTMRVCSWRMPNGDLMLSLANVPNATGREGFRAKLHKTSAILGASRAPGWTEERKDFGGVSCEFMMPPGQKGTPLTIACIAEAKEMMVIITTSGGARIPLEKAKMLVETATTRLP